MDSKPKIFSQTSYKWTESSEIKARNSEQVLPNKLKTQKSYLPEIRGEEEAKKWWKQRREKSEDFTQNPERK